VFVHTQLFTDDPTQKSVHVVIARHISDVLAKHDASCRAGIDHAVRLAYTGCSDDKFRARNAHAE
jgi:hypothetical protein